jgi:site-specific DNA-cytosine methylase
MRYLSVCSGIEAATVAWAPLGWEPVAFAEIEKFPSAVLAHHYPSVPNWGDLTKFREWPDATIDLLVGGTPCQSFSVAGLRAGLADPRGNLALTYLAVADRYRPRWVVWENVPGVLSSNGGGDFGAFLGGLGELGYGFAYRVLDAQYFGLAQRRARVFVVGHLGDWRRAAAVLFERESLSGHPAPRREAGERATGTLSSRTSAGGGLGTDFDVDGGLTFSLQGAGRTSQGSQGSGWNHDVSFTPNLTDVHAVAHSLRADGFDASYPAVCFDWQSGGDSRGLDPKGTAQLQRCQVPAVMHEALYNQGINHACPQETHASSLLRALRQEVGAEAFTQWGLGILDSLLPAEVLRSRLHGCGIRLTANFSRRWLVYHALSRPEAHSEGLMRAMREAEREGCASQGWQPPEQLARQLGAYLSELSQPGAQATRFMRDLWQASEGIGLLREALSAIQEVGRPARREGQPVRATADGDGAQPTEGVCGGGMSGAVSREGLLQPSCPTGEARDTRQATDDAQRESTETVGRGTFQVRRLTVEECEFLQGFPRGYTAIPYRGKPAADGPRYKALGNSMAVPCMRWIGERIALVEQILRERVA